MSATDATGSDSRGARPDRHPGEGLESAGVEEAAQAAEAAESAHSAESGQESTGSASERGPQEQGEEAERNGGVRLVLALVGTAAALLALKGVADYANLIAPVFFALNMVIIVHPFQRWLTHALLLPKWFGATVALVVVLVVLAAFFYSIGWALFALVQELPRYSDQFETIYNNGLNWLGQLGVTPDVMASNLQSNSSNIVSFATNSLMDVATNVSGVAGMVAIIVTVLFFFTVDSMSIDKRMRVILQQKPATGRALLTFSAGVRRYWVVTTVFGLIVALIDWWYLLFLGIPLAGVWAILSFVSNYIPNVGFVIGLIPPALMGLLAGGWKEALLVVAGYSVINVVMQSFIQPKFTGDAVGVTPTVSFVSVLLWAGVLGPLGALLALPATLFVKALLIDPNPQARFVNALVANTPEDGLPSEESNRARAAQNWFSRLLGGRHKPHGIGAAQSAATSSSPASASAASAGERGESDAGRADDVPGPPTPAVGERALAEEQEDSA